MNAFLIKFGKIILLVLGGVIAAGVVIFGFFNVSIKNPLDNKSKSSAQTNPNEPLILINVDSKDGKNENRTDSGTSNSINKLD